MITLTISWNIFIIWSVLRTMKLSKSLPFYKTRLSLIDLLMVLTVVILFLLKFT